MPVCTNIKITKQRVCSGDLRFPIKILERELTSPSDPINGDVDYEETFTTIYEVAAAITTPSGVNTFDSVNTLQTVSHIFYIRYLTGINAEHFIEYEGIYYKILELSKLDGRQLFLKIKCTERGDLTQEASHA